MRLLPFPTRCPTRRSLCKDRTFYSLKFILHFSLLPFIVFLSQIAPMVLPFPGCSLIDFSMYFQNISSPVKALLITGESPVSRFLEFSRKHVSVSCCLASVLRLGTRMSHNVWFSTSPCCCRSVLCIAGLFVVVCSALTVSLSPTSKCYHMNGGTCSLYDSSAFKRFLGLSLLPFALYCCLYDYRLQSVLKILFLSFVFRDF